MSGPIGSAYPGNLVASLFACVLGIVSIRSAMSAYRGRRKNADLQNWEGDLGVSLVTLLGFVYLLYAVWVHR